MTEYQRTDFAGFWRRFAALIIDTIAVSFIVFPFAFIVGLAAPDAILVQVPFDLFTTTTTISEDLEDDSSIERDDVLGLWTNYYKVTVEERETAGDTTRRDLVDSHTYLPVEKTTSGNIEFYVLFLYWIILESSLWQASLGKRIMGIQVVTEDGGRPSVFQCAARNLLKVLSGMILFIGFMMAGWTDRKQALHDKIPRLLVIKTPSPSSDEDSPPNIVAPHQ